jgi:hypothetical protein
MANYDWSRVWCDKKSKNYFKSNNLDSNFLLQHAAVIHESASFNFTTKFNLKKLNFTTKERIVLLCVIKIKKKNEGTTKIMQLFFLLKNKIMQHNQYKRKN